MTLGSCLKDRTAGVLGRGSKAWLPGLRAPTASQLPPAPTTYFPEPLTPITSSTLGASMSLLPGLQIPLPGQVPHSHDVTDHAPQTTATEVFGCKQNGDAEDSR